MKEDNIFEKLFKNHSITNEEHKKLINHIEEHKFLLNENIPFEITWDQAVFSWYDNIFRIVESHYNHWTTRILFSNVSISNFYFQVMEHWHYLKKDESKKTIYIEDAIVNYVKNYSNKKFLRNILYIFLKY